MNNDELTLQLKHWPALTILGFDVDKEMRFDAEHVEVYLCADDINKLILFCAEQLKSIGVEVDYDSTLQPFEK